MTKNRIRVRFSALLIPANVQVVFQGLEIKFPESCPVGVVIDPKKSDADSVGFLLRLPTKNDSRTYCFENRLPISVISSLCEIDIGSFMGSSDTFVHGDVLGASFYEALQSAVNTIGLLRFFFEDDVIVARLEIGNHYVNRDLSSARAKFLFRRL